MTDAAFTVAWRGAQQVRWRADGLLHRGPDGKFGGVRATGEQTCSPAAPHAVPNSSTLFFGETRRSGSPLGDDSRRQLGDGGSEHSSSPISAAVPNHPVALQL